MTEGILARQNFGCDDSVHPVFNLGQTRAQVAINISAQPVMGRSKAQAAVSTPTIMGKKEKKESKQTKPTPNTNPDSEGKSCLYYSEFGGGWYKIGELLEKEKRERAEKKLVGLYSPQIEQRHF